MILVDLDYNEFEYPTKPNKSSKSTKSNEPIKSTKMVDALRIFTESLFNNSTGKYYSFLRGPYFKSGSFQEPGRHLTIYKANCTVHIQIIQAKWDGTPNEPAPSG